MGILSSIVGAIALVSGLFAPASALAALGTSFGGQLVAPPIPCFHLPGFFLITIKPAGLSNVSFVYGPGSLGLTLPTHPGQQILGIADVPFFGSCNGVPNAQRIQLFGTSLI